MNPPRISVVLPVRNGLPWIREALDSLYAQTCGEFELLVVDDGCSDGTSELLASEGDPRLRVVAGERRGIAAALNRGIAQARGEFVARHDADDRSHPQRLGRQMTWLDAHPDVAVLATCAEYIDRDGQPVANEWTQAIRTQQDVATSPEAIRALLPLTCGVVHGSVMMRTSVLRDAGGYREEYVTAQDYNLWLRLVSHHRIAKLADRLYTFRVHPDQASGDRRPDHLERAISAKLDFLRRACPWVPRPARMIVADDTRGRAVYETVGPRFDFWPIPNPQSPIPNPSPAWNLLVVTDFSAVPLYSARLHRDIEAGFVVREGNLFVRAPGRRP